MLFIKALNQDNGGFNILLGDYKIHSVFQPIFQTQSKALMGYEALVRCANNRGELISPSKLFDSTQPQLSRIKTDLVAATLHALNYRKNKNTITGKLFININPASISYLHNHQRVWKTMLKSVHNNSISRCEYNFENLVIEIVEKASDSNSTFIQQLITFKEQGCLLAVDDFGSGKSDLKRIKQVNPDIVKLDKTILRKLRNRPIESCWNLKKKLSLENELIVMEGIENESDMQIAKQSGVEFVQGYYLGYPSTRPSQTALET
ncbi:EAL domain-containing protein [Vibrio sp. Sgm 22]|uniref:EAL domain-containing protein n=1 Tax=unclassified Vibrio TaxID=2614977 RepID=UPI002249694B|nr:MULTISPECIES: EAL domain-containing protein [unclassified Vibrio]MCX2760037.1 EAL domain-containing protein [Vibrio sp. 14G-20]MCX2777025.1 EAL domain-containing protein [Vibrio sp. Sgm 22]